MKKRTYIQPKMNVAVMPKYALMAMNPSPGEDLNPHAPKRVVTPAALANDSTKVF